MYLYMCMYYYVFCTLCVFAHNVYVYMCVKYVCETCVVNILAASVSHTVDTLIGAHTYY